MHVRLDDSKEDRRAEERCGPAEKLVCVGELCVGLRLAKERLRVHVECQPCQRRHWRVDAALALAGAKHLEPGSAINFEAS